MLLFGNLSKEINFSDDNLAQDKEEEEEEKKMGKKKQNKKETFSHMDVVSIQVKLSRVLRTTYGIFQLISKGSYYSSVFA